MPKDSNGDEYTLVTSSTDELKYIRFYKNKPPPQTDPIGMVIEVPRNWQDKVERIDEPHRR